MDGRNAFAQTPARLSRAPPSVGPQKMIYFSLLLSLGLGLATAAPPKAIVFILADDLGYNEMGFMNSTRGLQTPNLDALAAGGVRLTSAYTVPLCSPTRSSLMTGKYNHRLGTQANVVFWDTPWAPALEHTFLPQQLKRVPGFGATAMFGKCAWREGWRRRRRRARAARAAQLLPERPLTNSFSFTPRLPCRAPRHARPALLPH